MDSSEIGDPTRSISRRGGIYDPALLTSDPFIAFDMPDRIVALNRALAEHPAVRPYLERGELFYGPRARDGRIALRCARCVASPCECGDLSPRADEYMATIYLDDELRPLFDERNLAVRQ